MKYTFTSSEAESLYNGSLHRATEGSAGFDLRAVSFDDSFGTGVKVAIPEGYVGLVFIRSSLGFKHSHSLVNSVGVIDSDYRGEIKVKLAVQFPASGWFVDKTNPWKSLEAYTQSTHRADITIGDRIAQLVVIPFAGDATLVSDLDSTDRNEGGHGSTGKH